MKINIPIIVTIEIPEELEGIVALTKVSESSKALDGVDVRKIIMGPKFKKMSQDLTIIMRKELWTVRQLASQIKISTVVIHNILAGKSATIRSYQRIQRFIDGYHQSSA